MFPLAFKFKSGWERFFQVRQVGRKSWVLVSLECGSGMHATGLSQYPVWISSHGFVSTLRPSWGMISNHGFIGRSQPNSFLFPWIYGCSDSFTSFPRPPKGHMESLRHPSDHPLCHGRHTSKLPGMRPRSTLRGPDHIDCRKTGSFQVWMCPV